SLGPVTRPSHSARSLGRVTGPISQPVSRERAPPPRARRGTPPAGRRPTTRTSRARTAPDGRRHRRATCRTTDSATPRHRRTTRTTGTPAAGRASARRSPRPAHDVPITMPRSRCGALGGFDRVAEQHRDGGGTDAAEPGGDRARDLLAALVDVG